MRKNRKDVLTNPTVQIIFNFFASSQSQKENERLLDKDLISRHKKRKKK